MNGFPEITTADVRDLYEQFVEVDEDGSSNDVCQMLDDWFTEHGWPTVLYRSNSGRGQ